VRSAFADITDLAGYYLYNETHSDWLPTSAPRSWVGERNSIAFVNTGAHWNAALLKWRDQATAERVYAMMVRSRRCDGLTMQVDRVAPQLLSRPGLDVVVRGMTMPHSRCWENDAPIAQAVVPGHSLTAPDANDPVATGYGWTSFANYDRLWADALRTAYDPHPQSTRVFLNLTTISGQRPDAHLLGAVMNDCLHVRRRFRRCR